jgi:hypothetical protein
MSVSKITFLFFSLLMLSGCDVGSDEQKCHSDSIGVGVTAVTGPETAAVDETITLNVAFKVLNDCGSFQVFNKAATEDATIITVNVQYDGCSCGATDLDRTAPYTFKASVPGVYVLKFRITNSTYITHTITVS